jgi:hypothetical protein
MKLISGNHGCSRRSSSSTRLMFAAEQSHAFGAGSASASRGVRRKSDDPRRTRDPRQDDHAQAHRATRVPKISLARDSTARIFDRDSRWVRSGAYLIRGAGTWGWKSSKWSKRASPFRIRKASPSSRSFRPSRGSQSTREQTQCRNRNMTALLNSTSLMRPTELERAMAA